MKRLSVVVPELFAPLEIVSAATEGLSLPVLEKWLSRAQGTLAPPQSFDRWLCGAFGAEEAAVAPITLLADGVPPGGDFWLRADPVHLSLQHNQMIVQTNVAPSREQAASLCAGLNAHFSGDGLEFFAPHPLRWYLRLNEMPALHTHSIFEVDGLDARHFQPWGEQALRWQAWLTEVQMLLSGHEINRQLEASGCLPINSVWLWGGGRTASLRPEFVAVGGDGELLQAFACASGMGVSSPAELLRGGEGERLWIWDDLAVSLRRGDWQAWRTGLQRFERECAAPALRGLARGDFEELLLIVPQAHATRRFVLSRWGMMAVWRRQAQPLAHFAPV